MVSVGVRSCDSSASRTIHMKCQPYFILIVFKSSKPRKKKQQNKLIQIKMSFAAVEINADSRRAVVSFWRKNVHNTG